MVSFDVTSLFTNIPVDETIEIISNHIFANCMYFEGFDRSQFIKLLSSIRLYNTAIKSSDNQMGELHLCWTGNIEQLKQFVSDNIELNGVWVSPGGFPGNSSISCNLIGEIWEIWEG